MGVQFDLRMAELRLRKFVLLLVVGATTSAVQRACHAQRATPNFRDDTSTLVAHDLDQQYSNVRIIKSSA